MDVKVNSDNLSKAAAKASTPKNFDESIIWVNGYYKGSIGSVWGFGLYCQNPNPHQRRFSILGPWPLSTGCISWPGWWGGSQEVEGGEDLVFVLVLILVCQYIGLECISWSGWGGGSEEGEEDSQKHRHRAPIYVLSPSYPCWSPKKSFGNIENTMDRRTKVSFYFGIWAHG